MEFTAKGVSEMKTVAEHVAKLLAERKLALVRGPIGAGKTTLVQMIVKAMGYKGHVASPTFTIANEYRIADKTVYHLDLYRLTDSDIASGFLDDYFRSDCVTIVEWPERLPKHLIKENAIKINLGVVDGGKARTAEVI